MESIVQAVQSFLFNDFVVFLPAWDNQILMFLSFFSSFLGVLVSCLILYRLFRWYRRIFGPFLILISSLVVTSVVFYVFFYSYYEKNYEECRKEPTKSGTAMVHCRSKNIKTQEWSRWTYVGAE